MRELKGLFIVFAIFGAAFAQNPEPPCRAGTAQPSAIDLVRKLERAFEKGDAAAFSAHARCPFLVGKYETDSASYVPSRIFAERFLDEVTTLELALKRGDVGSAYPEGPKRIFLLVDGGRGRAELVVDRKPRENGKHRHIFLLERGANGWYFSAYGTTDDNLPERLRRGYPKISV